MLREMRIEDCFHSFFTDCRFSRRQLQKSPIFTTVAVLTLALGTGSSTAIFSTIDGTLLHPILTRMQSAWRRSPSSRPNSFALGVSLPEPLLISRDATIHSTIWFGLVYREVRFTSANGSEEFSGGSVTPGTFEALGIAPLFGRGLRADDYRPGAPPVFVISYGLWTKLFNRAPNVLGNTYRLNGAPVALVGVMPARFQIGGCDLWLPLDITRDTFVPGAGIESNEIWTVGHLKIGVSPESAAADLQVIASPFQADDRIYFPPHFRIVVNTLNSQSVGDNFKLGLLALMGAVMILLLIACSNVANLLLARATTREREFGIRSAVGASRTHIIRQLLVESFALAAVSCALGCIFAIFGLQVMVALIPSGTIPPGAAITFSSSALLFSLIVTVFTTVACGLAPAIHALRTDAQIALSGPGKGTGVDHRQGTLRSALVVTEVALSVILKSCSALIMRRLFALHSVSTCLIPTEVVYARILRPECQS